MNSRGRQPTVQREKHIRPRRGRTIPSSYRGFHPRLFMFGRLAAKIFLITSEIGRDGALRRLRAVVGAEQRFN